MIKRVSGVPNHIVLNVALSYIVSVPRAKKAKRKLINKGPFGNEVSDFLMFLIFYWFCS